MLKSCRNFERSERSKVWKLGAFETVDFLSSLSNLRQRFWSIRRFNSSEISKIWKQSLSKVRTQSFQKAFDVKRSEISTSNARKFPRRTLWDFDVERSEISTSNAQRFRRRTLGDSDFKVLTFELLKRGKQTKNCSRWYIITITCIFSVYVLNKFWNILVLVWLFRFNLFVYSLLFYSVIDPPY